jgi:hypothetical protein
MSRKIAVSIGDANKEYCNNCPFVTFGAITFCDAFEGRPELNDIEIDTVINGPHYITIRLPECISAEIKGEKE